MPWEGTAPRYWFLHVSVISACVLFSCSSDERWVEGVDEGSCEYVTAAEYFNVDDEFCDFGSVEDTGVERVALRAAESCEHLDEAASARAVNEMIAMIEDACRASLHTSRRIGDCSSNGWGDGDADTDVDADADTDADGDGDVDGDGDADADEYSTTNTQEVDVDEADFIKNDGSYFYILAGDQFVVLQAWPASELREISRTTVVGTPQKMYVHDDNVVIYSYQPASRCYDTYNYQFGGCVTQWATTTITVLDISAREAPRLARRLQAPGIYVDSRRIDDAVHTVIATPEEFIGELRLYAGDPFGFPSPDQFREAWESLIEHNTDAIRASSGSVALPEFTDFSYDTDGTVAERRIHRADCGDVMLPAMSMYSSFLTVLGLDLSRPDVAELTTISGEQGVVYSSREALWVAAISNPGVGGTHEHTTVHRFAYAVGEAGVDYEGSGRVPGSVLNQFSMGEHDGFLRLATTSGRERGSDTSNSVFVLEPVGDGLEIVGSVTGIAPREDIRSARFVGDRAFVVTYVEETGDPLFTFDLSDPRNPRQVGELHIPGFSTYMHPLDHDHILTIGLDAERWFEEVWLQIFDVSDFSRPTLTHRYEITTHGSSSEASTNHLAFNYFRSRNALAIPLAECVPSWDGDSYDMAFNGLMVFDVEAEAGISEHGRIDHNVGASCSTWWTEPGSWVRRSVFMEDFVYSVAPDRIIVAHLDDLSSPVASIDLPR